jgi:hypothetical protein
MFPAAHLYVATKACRTGEPLFVVGSILPDIFFVRPITHDETHFRTPEFREYLLAHDPSYQLLAAGMMTHGMDPKGVDYLSDVGYDEGVGYAYENSRSLVPAVEKNCKLTGKNAVTAAHNFAEMAVDHLVLRDNPKILSLLRKSLDIIDRNDIAQHLSGFYPKGDAEVRSAVNEYFDVLHSAKLDSIEGLVETEAWVLNKIFNVHIDTNHSRYVLSEAITIVAPTYQQFLDRSMATVRGIDFKIKSRIEKSA